MTPSTTPFLNRQRYECRWAYFWAGFLDWWAERCDPGSALSVAATSKAGRRPIWAVALTAWGLLLGLALVAAALGPTLAGGMNLVGTQAIASISVFIAIAAVFAAVVAAPVWAGVRVHRFVRATCLRGWELEVSQRRRYAAR